MGCHDSNQGVSYIGHMERKRLTAVLTLAVDFISHKELSAFKRKACQRQGHFCFVRLLVLLVSAETFIFNA